MRRSVPFGIRQLVTDHIMEVQLLHDLACTQCYKRLSQDIQVCTLDSATPTRSLMHIVATDFAVLTVSIGCNRRLRILISQRVNRRLVARLHKANVEYDMTLQYIAYALGRVFV